VPDWDKIDEMLEERQKRYEQEALMKIAMERRLKASDSEEEDY